ncbi:hypothetical protein [Motilibacter rhizosphaerae]|uniref:hypothetical protein n=1 Tax=Motilibacter rhizosphaerae TaxID=598652 RepID=UPI00102B496C|nr:hypothetical protein [Motilibacter rhizosphaerae]
MGDSALVGLVGEVVTRVRGGAEPGEVRLLFRGAYETFIAYADVPIARGEGALVASVRHNGAVDVLPWANDGVQTEE